MDNVKGRVLCVEDDNDNRDMIIALLNMEGYEVIPAKNLAQGLDMGTANNIDLILLDWMFEDGTGIDLCRMLRSAGTTTPILFYSGMGNNGEIERAMQAGAQGFLVKPVAIDVLLKSMSTLVRRKAGGERANLAPPVEIKYNERHSSE